MPQQVTGRFLSLDLGLSIIIISYERSGLTCINEIHTGEPSCTIGFPPSLTTAECFNGQCLCRSSPPVLILCPQMRITCNGTLVGWTAAAARRFLWGAGPNTNTMLNIWRERNADLEIYDRVGAPITLEFCENRVETRGSYTIFECILPQNSRLPVQTGDIIGLEVTTDDWGYQILYHRTAAGRSYRFNRRNSATIRLRDSYANFAREPQISLTVEPAVDDLTTTIPHPTTSTTQISTTSTTVATTKHERTTLFPTTPTPQAPTPFNFTDVPEGSTLTTVKIAGAAAGGVVMIVLYLVIIVFVIKRCRMIILNFKSREFVEMMDAKMEEASQVSKNMGVDNEYHDARYVTKCDATYCQQANKEVVQHAGQYYDNDTMSRYEQVPSKKLYYKKGTTPTISNNYLGCHGLYTSPKAKSGSAKVQHLSGARYETISGYERAAVYEKADIYEMAAVYEQAVVYEKAVVYEQAAIYEKAITYEKAAV